MIETLTSPPGREPKEILFFIQADAATSQRDRARTEDGRCYTLMVQVVDYLGLPHHARTFGTPDYSKEELVAEFGAAFLSAHAGILPRTVDNSASYIDGWLRALQQDKRLLPIAASQAQKAADFILGAAHGESESGGAETDA